MAPGISIIIATRNKEALLWQTVEKACAAIGELPVEIIVVNDGDVALTVPPSLAAKVTCYDNPVKGVSLARNLGVSRAKGPVLFFIDDDMWIHRDALTWIMETMSDEVKATAVYNINWEYPPVLTARLTTTKVGNYLLAGAYNTMWGRMHVKEKQPQEGLFRYHGVIASCSLVMLKRTFEKIGGYNPDVIFPREDVDISNRMHAIGIPVFGAFDITLQHNHQDRLEINWFLEREMLGYKSEFGAAKAGIMSTLSKKEYKGFTKLIFEFFRITEKGWIFLLNILPGNRFFTPVNNRLIGILSGLQRYKQWQNMMA